MKFALVGVGGAGGRIVEQLRTREAATDREFSNDNVLAFDTTKEAFEQYSKIPLDRHVLVGDMHPDIQGEGVEGDVDLAASAAREDVDEIHREFDKLALHEVDAIVVCLGLAGGTGGGVGPVVIDNLDAVSDNPIYAVGVLPHRIESDQHAVNAARALQSVVKLADNTILFDNDAWFQPTGGGQPGEDDMPSEEQTASDSDEAESSESTQEPRIEAETLEAAYDELNEILANRLISVLAVGERQTTDLAENRIDSSDLMRTLETGGVSTIGHHETTIRNPKSLIQRILALFRNGTDDEPATEAVKIQQLIKSGATGRLTLPCDISSTERALVVLSGPPHVCSRKGFESGRHWLEEETGSPQVLAGDEPRPKAGSISATILFSNVTEVPSIERLKERAVTATRKDQLETRPLETPSDDVDDDD